MEDNRKEVLLATVLAIYVKRLKNPKSKWTKAWLRKRQFYTHTNLLRELSLEPADWRNYMKMDEASYLQLLALVTPLIQKKNTVMREAISPHERLCATLRFLASGLNYEDLKYGCIISPQRLGVIIPETCMAIITVLKTYMKMPNTTEEWTKIGKLFQKKWQFPNCLGAVDGKHIKIIPPPDSGSTFYNYKGFHSVVLMACANANYEFVWCEVGINGRISDGGAIKETQFYKKLVEKKLNIPKEGKVGSRSLPYVFIGDEAFALREDFLKPYNRQALTPKRKIFNYRLSRARRIVENVFGIISSRFKIFQSAINLRIDRIDLIVLTCCVLHNFLRKSSSPYASGDMYTEDINVDSKMTALQVSQSKGNHTNDAKKVREAYTDYFNAEGSVSWQKDRI